MFKSVRDYVDGLSKDGRDLQDYLNKLRGARRRLTNSVSKAEEQITLFNNPTRYVASIEPQIRNDVLQLAKNTLFTTALAATRQNKEFSDVVYFEPLADVIEEDGTYRIKFTGSGWEKRITVDIDLRKTAGNLNDWARGVRLYRADIGVRVPRSNDKNKERRNLQASRAWRRIYTEHGTEFLETVSGRIERSGRPAPFWEILDKGTVPMASNRGDGSFPTPKNKRTNFVDEAKTAINNQVKNYISSLRSQYEELINGIRKEVSELNKKIEEVDERIQNATIERSELRRVRAGLNVDNTDEYKLLNAIARAKEGIQGRVDIGVPGSRRRTTFRKIRTFL